MPISELYALYQHVLVAVCAVALVAMGVVAAFAVFAPFWSELWERWLRLDGWGRSVATLGLICAVMYGGSKGFWTPVRDGGADTGIGLVGIYTGVSNDVVEVAGEVTTNRIPMVAVMWTNGTVTASTKVSYRASNTNDWTEVVKNSPEITAEGTTNILQFITSEDLSGYPMWWAGDDLPATIITSSSIDVTAYVETADYIRIEWTCSQPLATEFSVYYKKTTDAEWRLVTTTSNKWIQVSGFYVGDNGDWKIASTYLEDGE